MAKEERLTGEVVARYYADMDLLPFARVFLADKRHLDPLPTWQRSVFNRTDESSATIEATYLMKTVTFGRNDTTADRWHPYLQVRHLARLKLSNGAAKRFVRQQELAYRKVIEYGEENAKRHMQEQMRDELDRIERQLLLGQNPWIN